MMTKRKRKDFDNENGRRQRMGYDTQHNGINYDDEDDLESVVPDTNSIHESNNHEQSTTTGQNFKSEKERLKKHEQNHDGHVVKVDSLEKEDDEQDELEYYNDKIQDEQTSNKNSKIKPQVDPFFGQTGAFPEPVRRIEESNTLNDDDDDDQQDGLTIDAWSYLKSVRSEAEKLPTVVHVKQEPNLLPRSSNITPQVGGVIFSDGACIGLSTPVTPSPLSNKRQENETYHASVCESFLLHRESILSSISSSSSTPINEDSAFPCRPKSLLTHSPPATTAQLVHLGKNLQFLLHHITALEADITALLAVDQPLSQDLSTWSWILMGLLPVVGVLSGEQISTLRELGKRCIWGLEKLETLRKWKEKNRSKNNGRTLEEAKVNALNKLEDGDISTIKEGQDKEEEVETSSVMLHTIITIIAEFYGQRDLLDMIGNANT